MTGALNIPLPSGPTDAWTGESRSAELRSGSGFVEHGMTMCGSTTHRVGGDRPTSLGWTDRALAPDDVDEGLDEFGNRVTGKWMPKGLTPELWARVRGATIEGDLGPQAKVLKDFTRACVYTRDYRDIDDLRRVLLVLRKIGIKGWIDYKRDCDTQRGLYGHGALYWCSPPGTVDIEAPKWSVGREMDRDVASAATEAVLTPSATC